MKLLPSGCSGPFSGIAGKAGAVLALTLAVPLFLAPQPPAAARGKADVPDLLARICGEVVEMGKRPGEDFSRGEFFLGEGDDDTYKTHSVGILVQDRPEGRRMTVVVSRLEASRENPRIQYTRESKTIVCRFGPDGAEIMRSDYPAADLRKLLSEVLRAVIEKKNLLRTIRPSSRGFR